MKRKDITSVAVEQCNFSAARPNGTSLAGPRVPIEVLRIMAESDKVLRAVHIRQLADRERREIVESLFAKHSARLELLIFLSKWENRLRYLTRRTEKKR